MKTIEFPVRLKENLAKCPNFRQALTRLEKGKESTPRSWVYENLDPDAILNGWKKILTAEEDLSYISDWDTSKSSKYAPQGCVAPFSQRQHTLKEYWTHLSSSQVFRTKDWQKAKAITIRQLGLNRSGRPYSVDDVISYGLHNDKYNTSSGDPMWLKRKNELAIQQARSALQTGTEYSYYPTLGSRASMGKTGTEARWIFMFPMCVNIREQTFLIPLQEYIRTKSVTFFTPWEGYEAVQKVLSKSRPSGTVNFGCDYTKMDQHFNLYHGLEVYDVIKEYFEVKYHASLKMSICNIFSTPVISCDGLIVGKHSMPSGSGWTNFLETMFNYILVNYVRLHYGLRISNDSMGIGDDQIWFIEGVDPSVSLDALAQRVASFFLEVGLDANPEKQEVSREIISFLQRRSWITWSPEGIQYAGVYPTVRALTSEVFPEFYHNEEIWTKKTFALRCLMIMENCCHHPKFKEFCIYIAKGNEAIVEFCLSSDAEILLVRHSAKGIANFLPTYNQEKINASPITFSSLQIIRSYFQGKRT